MNFHLQRALAVLLFFLVLPAQSYGLMLSMSTEKLTRGAQLVIIGEVEETVCQWSADKSVITTKATIAVQRVIKGRLDKNTITVITIGGKVGDIVMRQSDAARLEKGERVLLFLVPGEQGDFYSVSGRAQGKYSIAEDRIARKRGFSVQSADEKMDLSISLEALVEKIEKYAEEE